MNPDLGLVTVASWNLHGGVDVTGDPYDAVCRCAALGADVLALQEVAGPDGRDLAAEVAEALGYTCVVAGDVASPSRVALLHRIAMTPLPSVALTPSPAWCGPRAAARGMLDVAGTPVAVTAVHLCHRPDASLRQLRALRAVLDADAGPAVLLGDCNLWRFGVRAALPGWMPAAVGPTWPAPRPHHQIDHVLVRGLRAVGGEIVALGGSDHRAVRATLVAAAPPSEPAADAVRREVS